MRIKLITFTGADETVDPVDIIRLGMEFPNSEWALLLSHSNMGKSSRYPSSEWMHKFIELASGRLNLAGHLQGKWLRGLTESNFTFPDEYPFIWQALSRIQLNFHSVPTTCVPGWTDVFNRFPSPDFLFQLDGVNDHLLPMLANTFPFFDASAGAGIVPEKWPRPIHPKLNGYAGGLGPHNVKAELEKIAEVVNDGDIWIDMETHIRDDGDKFSLNKCREVLEICAKEYKS